MPDIANLLAAAQALIARLEEMTQPLNDLCVFRSIHGMPYTGPNWGEPLAALRTAVDAAKAAGDDGARDRQRLMFVLSVLNRWDRFGEFVEGYVDGASTSRQRATDAEWLTMIDRAMAADGQEEGK